jgi:hypothetical protein
MINDYDSLLMYVFLACSCSSVVSSFCSSIASNYSLTSSCVDRYQELSTQLTFVIIIINIIIDIIMVIVIIIIIIHHHLYNAV